MSMARLTSCGNLKPSIAIAEAVRGLPLARGQLAIPSLFSPQLERALHYLANRIGGQQRGVGTYVRVALCRLSLGVT